MDRALLDTDIASEVLKGKNARVAQRAVEYLAEYGRLTTSALTVMEIVKGYQKVLSPADLSRKLAALRRYEVLPFDEEAAIVAGQIHGDLERAGRPLGRVDPMIAALALHLGLTLVTGNTTHCERIRALGYGLRLEDWRTAAPQGTAGPAARGADDGDG